MSFSAYASEICYFHMNFYKTSLNLKFCDNAHLYMHYLGIVLIFFENS
jgi:hypothetical protein